MRRFVSLLAAMLLLAAMTTGTALAERAVPRPDQAIVTMDNPEGLPGESAEVRQALQERSVVQYRILVIDDVKEESREAYLDRVLAHWGWPPADTLQLVIFAQANYDLYFAMGSNFKESGVTLQEMLDLVHTVYVPAKREGDPAKALAQFIRAVNKRMMPAEGMSPEQVVRAFYGWHIGSFSHTDESLSAGNTLASGAYKTSPYLTPDYIGRIGETLAGFQGGGADLFVCAQAFPERITFDKASISGDEATASAYTHWSTGTKQLTISLKRADGQWQIDRIGCPKN